MVGRERDQFILSIVRLVPLRRIILCSSITKLFNSKAGGLDDEEFSKNYTTKGNRSLNKHTGSIITFASFDDVKFPNNYVANERRLLSENEINL